MTEQEWLDSTDPTIMFPDGGRLPRLPERKHRLFSLACCASMKHLIKDQSLKAALATVVRYTEGTASLDELSVAHRDAVAVCHALNREGRTEQEIKQWAAAKAVVYATLTPRQQGKVCQGDELDCEYDPYNVIGWESAYSAARALKKSKWKEIASLVRDIAGNPFRPVAIEPAWQTWNDGTVVNLAQAIYDDAL